MSMFNKCIIIFILFIYNSAVITIDKRAIISNLKDVQVSNNSSDNDDNDDISSDYTSMDDEEKYDNYEIEPLMTAESLTNLAIDKWKNIIMHESTKVNQFYLDVEAQLMGEYERTRIQLSKIHQQYLKIQQREVSTSFDSAARSNQDLMNIISEMQSPSPKRSTRFSEMNDEEHPLINEDQSSNYDTNSYCQTNRSALCLSFIFI